MQGLLYSESAFVSFFVTHSIFIILSFIDHTNRLTYSTMYCIFKPILYFESKPIASAARRKYTYNLAKKCEAISVHQNVETTSFQR